MFSELLILCSMLHFPPLCYLQSFSEYEWSAWSNWPMACSSTCKVGQRCRIRKCQNAKGKVVPASKCGEIKEAKECQNCVAKGICPIDAQWSEWYPWTDCQITNPKGCGDGSKQRIRTCNNPKPKYEGIYCIGNSSDSSQCSISCSDTNEGAAFLKDTIKQHFQSLSYNVIMKSHGDPATLDCYTLAYLKASSSNKKLFVLWNFNGIQLRSLRELLLNDMKALQLKFNKAGVKTSFTLPKGHIQFTGSKLIIDSVSDDDTGVYTCTLNYDYVDLINTFFVLMVSGKREYAREFDYFVFNSNTDGLEKIDYFDSAEIRWYINGKLSLIGLLATLEKRFYTVYVNRSMEGQWECRLYADFNKNRQWVVNSFFLRIGYPRSLWDKFADDPILSRFSFYFGCGIFLMATVSLISFLIVKLRSAEWLNLERKQAIIQEEVYNNRLILMVARKRAMEKTIDLMKMSGDLDENKEEELEQEDD